VERDAWIAAAAAAVRPPPLPVAAARIPAVRHLGLCCLFRFLCECATLCSIIGVAVVIVDRVAVSLLCWLVCVGCYESDDNSDVAHINASFGGGGGEWPGCDVQL
jgi:hypothetical protein